MIGLLAVDFLILEAIYIAWRQYCIAAPLLNSVLDVSPTDHSRLVTWLRTWLRPFPQVVACATAAIALSMLCWTEQLATLSALSVAAVIVTGCAVGQALYLNVLTVLLGRFFRDVPSIRVTWANPIGTPGMVSLNRAVQTQARAGLGLLALVSLPLTYAYLGRHTLGASLGYLVMITLAAGSVIVVGITVQIWLAEPIRKERAKILAKLSEQIQADNEKIDGSSGSAMAGDDTIDRLKARLELFKSLAGTPAAFWGSGSFLRYALAAVPIIAQLVAGLIAAQLR
jgi:hypothetical protein